MVINKWKLMATAPKDGTPILAKSIVPNPRNDNRSMFVVSWQNGKWNGGSNENFVMVVKEELLTHWMALPAPPNARMSLDEMFSMPDGDD